MQCSAVDLFCGIGGLTKGLSLANIDVSAGFDIEERCKFIYERNNKAEFICYDVNQLKAEDVIKFYKKGTVKALVGCAPCQPFSKYSSKYRKNGHCDTKWRLLYSFGRLVQEIKPDIVSIENVPQLIYEAVFDDFVDLLKKGGYFVSFSIVSCMDYGVPQHRKRLVLLASQFGEIYMIKPTYDQDTYLTVRDAIGFLPPIKAGETCLADPMHCASTLSSINMQRIKQSVPGGTWRDWDNNLRLNCHKRSSGETFPSVYGRMVWDKPSPTITTQFYGYGNGRFGHPEQDRAISLREGALLQTFPVNYVFTDEEHPIRKREIATYIGNAVPVELGRAIGKSIQQHIASMEN